jgi:hypothetical protein
MLKEKQKVAGWEDLPWYASMGLEPPCLLLKIAITRK